jgi:hypothetical protein
VENSAHCSESENRFQLLTGRPPRGCGAIRTYAEDLHRVIHVDETGVRRDACGPLLHRTSFDLHAPPARAAGDVVMMGPAGTTAVQRLAVLVPDRVDRAVLAEHHEMAVDGRQADAFASVAELGMDVLRAAEPGQALKGGGQRLGLSCSADPSAPNRL